MIFAPAFQPIKDVGTGSFVAAEVLARWYDEGRVLTPSSLSSPPYWGLVDMEMARFIQDNLHYCLDLYPALFLNVSEHTLQSDVIFKAWWRVVRDIAKNHSSRLVIEITEGIQDASLALRWEALTEIGVELALDDYGDKNSSLERLSRYDWHYCKFDARRLRSLEDYWPSSTAAEKAYSSLLSRWRASHWGRAPNYLDCHGNKVSITGSLLSWRNT